MMSPLDVFLLGSARLEINGSPVEISSRKAMGLLIYLVVENRPKPRLHLATLFWPEHDKSRANASLRRALADIKKALGSDWLIANRKTVQCNPDAPIRVDVQQFRALLTADPHTTQAITKAVALYRGDFLTGFSLPDSLAFDEWQLFEQESLRQLYAHALEMAIDHARVREDWSSAIKYARRLVAQDPLNETAQRRLITLYIADEQPSAALQQFESCKAILQEELGIEPDEETLALLAQIGDGEQRRPNNLPPLEGRAFIGRTDELAHIHQLLTDPNTRLLNLVGMGGTGKTALALQFAHRTVNQVTTPFTDGIFYVALAAVWQERDVISAATLVTMIADALALPLSETTAPKRQLLDALRGKRLLLIIDNGESLARDARLLHGDLLTAAPTIKILVTSREQFNLRDEWVLPLKGLPYMGEEQDAVLLFEERARQKRADFQTSFDEAALHELCRLTEGIPLALELAAAWVHLLSLPQLVAEIKAKLDLLQANHVDVEERHRSMRAVFDQSWDRLEWDEQVLLERLAIFVNTFDYAAASQVAGASLLLLGRLNEKSLLQIIAHESGRRFKLHPLLRQFILENSNIEQLNLVSEQHAVYFGGYMQAKGQQFNNGSVTDALDEIQLNIDDVQAGWQWAFEQQSIKLLAQFQPTQVRFYLWRSRWHLAVEISDAILKIKPKIKRILRESTFEHLVAWYDILLANSLTFVQLNDHTKAEQCLSEGRQIAHRTEDSTQLADIYAITGAFERQRGNHSQAKTFLKFSSQFAEESADAKSFAYSLMALGGAAKDNGEFAQAQMYFEQSLITYRRISYQWGIIHVLRLLGEALASQGEYETGLSYVTESLNLGQQSDDEITVALAHQVLGEICISRKRYEMTEEHLLKGLHLFQRVNYGKGIIRSLSSLAQLADELGDKAAAHSKYKESFENALLFEDLPLALDVVLKIAEFTMSFQTSHLVEDNIVRLLSTVYNHPSTNARQKNTVVKLSRQLKHTSVNAPNLRLSLPEVKEAVADLISFSSEMTHIKPSRQHSAQGFNNDHN